MLIIVTSMSILSAQTNKTVGSGGNYTTLKAAFDAINAGTITGNINLKIISSTTETASASLNASGSGSANYTSIQIYPTGSGYTISGNLSNPLINLNGADNVVIDGRVNASGSTKDLIITNTNTGTSSSTIKFINSSENNTIKYCTIKGSATSSGNAIVLFSNATSGNGNDNNLIDNNNITSDAGGRVNNAIYSWGTVGRENSGNTISNNNIYNFFRTNSYSYGINIAANSSDWTISDNSFYETSTFVPASANVYYVITIGTSVSHIVSGNYIGGSAPLCAGSAWTINSNFPHNLYVINLSGGTTTPVTLQNNVIQNINYTSTNSNPWDGMYLASGNINVTGNTIGSATGTGSITINNANASATATISGGAVTGITIIGGGSGFTTAPTISFSQSGSTVSATATATITGGVVTGYTITNGGSGYTSAPTVMFNGYNGYATTHGIRHQSSGIVTISNNTIGSITTVGNNAYSHCLEAIVISGSAPSISITNNLIGSLTTANSLQTSSLATSSIMKQDLRGIFVNSNTPNSTITGNTIANLTSNYLGNQTSKLDGICTSGGSNIIQNNTIRNFSADAASVLVKGIQQTVTSTGTNQTVSGNTISNLTNTSIAANVTVTGIQYSGSTASNNIVSGNFVHSLSISSSSTNLEMDGIVLAGGVVTCVNNIIDLGLGVSSNCKIYGIYDNSGGVLANNNYIYFNSIYIAGNAIGGTTSSTAALWNSNNGSIRNYRNNILMNVRSGGAGKHYAIRVSGTTGLTIDYNDYYASSGILGSCSGADKTTLPLWKTATGQDLNSLNTDPLFFDPGDTNPSDYVISATLNGIAITGITTDYLGITRGVPPRMGALEKNDFVWKGATSTDFNTASNWLNGEVPLSGANIVFDASPNNDCILDQNRIIGKITNAQSTYKLITNGFQFTINDSIKFTNGAQIDASSNNSIIKFNGTSAQIVPSGTFLNNIVDGLNINNTYGLTLNGDLTINSSIALNAGNFAIGSNTLTFNGIVTAMTGTVTGGSSTNMIIGGTAGSISMPAFLLNNLTINRASGVNLYGNLSIVGTLTLTSGTLTVGANTLTISGNTITRTSGYINVSNASANIVFSNTSALNLPASIFSGAVNNMSVTGIGGVTANSDFTINGILNLNNGSTSVPNASSTKGLLDMGANTLTMTLAATNTGFGDVTGPVRRDNPIANTLYSFGNPVTTFILIGNGTAPSYITMIATIGTSTTNEDLPILPQAPVLRHYEILMPITAPGLFTAFKLHYLDSELNGNTESALTTGDYDIPTAIASGGSGKGYTSHDEHGISSYDITTPGAKFFEGLNIPIDYYMYVLGQTGNPGFPHDWRTMFSLYTHNNNSYRTWKTAALTSSWTTSENWVEGTAPISTSRVIIPDAITITGSLPILPSGNLTLQSISIGDGVPLTALGNVTITATGAFGGGAWNDVSGGFIPNGYKVIFTGMGAGITGTTQFYDVEIANGASIRNMMNNIMKIGNYVTKTGTGQWFADLFNATIEYNKNGAQTVTISDATPHFHTLVLSGSGAKTLPSSPLTIHADLHMQGTASASANQSLNIGGNLVIDSIATFITGAYNHNINGSLNNDGIFTATSGNTITMNGSTTAQAIEGRASLTTLYNLTVNNSFSAGSLSITSPVKVTNTLSLTNRNIFTYDSIPFTLASGSSVVPDGGSLASFIDGPMIKEGNTAFVFPIGDGIRWARLGIGAPTAITSFKGRYSASSDSSICHLSTTVYPLLADASTLEHWHLDRLVGAGNATVTLYWEDASWSQINDCASLRIAHGNTVDSTWENNNDDVTTTGTCSGTSSGSISTNYVVNTFSPFTFGSNTNAYNPLSVELISFNATYTSPDVFINWSTASESNNAYFTVEKSSNATDFYSIGIVQGKGTTSVQNNYSLIDSKPANGTNYYRLRQTDYNGKSTISEIVAINISNSAANDFGFDIYPNPIFSSESTSIKVSNFDSEKEILVVVYNILGVKMFSKILVTDKSGNLDSILDSASKLPVGAYIIVGTCLNQTFKKYLIIN